MNVTPAPLLSALLKLIQTMQVVVNSSRIQYSEPHSHTFGLSNNCRNSRSWRSSNQNYDSRILHSQIMQIVPQFKIAFLPPEFTLKYYWSFHWNIAIVFFKNRSIGRCKFLIYPSKSPQRPWNSSDEHLMNFAWKCHKTLDSFHTSHEKWHKATNHLAVMVLRMMVSVWQSPSE